MNGVANFILAIIIAWIMIRLAILSLIIPFFFLQAKKIQQKDIFSNSEPKFQSKRIGFGH